MRIKEIRYLRRKNLGNYQHEEIELVAHLDDDSNTEQAIAQLKKEAREALNISAPNSETAF